MTAAAWMPLLWFGLIVVTIPAVLWLVKRSGLLPAARGGTAAPLQLTGSLPLGPQQRVVTVQVGEGSERRWLVLGVTAQQITTLHTLTVPPTGGDISAGREGAGSGTPLLHKSPDRTFAQVLAGMLKTSPRQPAQPKASSRSQSSLPARSSSGGPGSESHSESAPSRPASRRSSQSSSGLSSRPEPSLSSRPEMVGSRDGQ